MSRRGFTLIELLVVVAIIALLISILLPSLSKARAQARTTLCASRISQLGKAFFLYGEDFGELFPFHIVYGEIPPWGGGGEGGIDELDPNEDWLASKEQMRDVFLTSEEDWPAHGVDLPRSGSLFPYTRFAALYACPEFVRRTENGLASVFFDDPGEGDQRAFNYTRGAWCRKPTFSTDAGLRLEFDGPIVTQSKVHAPASAILLIDEAWYSHVGMGRRSGPGHYRAADPVWDITSSVGIYHGVPVPGEVWFKYGSENLVRDVGVKRGNVMAYDGHVELYRDPCPLVDSNSGRPTIPMLIAGGVAWKEMVSTMVFALVGTPFSGL
ncbi:MAG: prepilin-type N-terminal cleavage/methylation domain-containing protein [Phycisphaerae bacterium]|nr:prepilin-type N-terminal cleavage/methylation domain-containing protein [Phycisphaerae bacterium]